MKKTWLIIIIVLVCVGGFLLLARLLTGEDSWICQSGQWVKHGAPSSPMPSKPCGSSNLNTNQVNANQNANASNDCDEWETKIMALITAVNYCQADSDCVIGQGFACPFGCYSLYNKAADLSQIKTELAKYVQVCPICAPECITTPETKDVKCRAGKCVNTRLDNIVNQ